MPSCIWKAVPPVELRRSNFLIHLKKRFLIEWSSMFTVVTAYDILDAMKKVGA